MKTFTGKTAVITGAASGIGRALADRLAAEGMRIVLADVEAKPLKVVEEAMKSAGYDVYAVRTDVSSASSVASLARKALERYGKVHVLCNNAGVSPPDRFKPVWESSLEDWKWALGVNLWGVVHGIHHFLPHMLAHGEEGHIVNTASIVGLISGPSGAAYSVTKHGVVRLSEAVYSSLRERGGNIGTTLLCPGVVATGIYNSERNRPRVIADENGPVSTDHEMVKSLYLTSLKPEQVAEQVLQAIRDQIFYVITTDAYDKAIKDRMTAILERRNPEFPDMLEMAKRDSGQV